MPDYGSQSAVQQLEWSFVGREDHVAALVENLRSKRSVMLVGNAGHGKTTLARQALAALSDAAVIHLRGSTITSGLQYGAIGPLTTELADEDLAHPLMVLQKVADRLNERAAGKPVVLFADNIQHLDELSALVISQLTVQGTVTLLAVCESVADASPEFQYLWRDGKVIRMGLGPMSYTEAERVLGQELGGRLSSFAVTELWSAAAGNPLLLRLLIQQQISVRNLIRSGSSWGLRAPIILEEGPLKDLVLDRLRSLSTNEQQVVELLSLAGTLPLAALHQVVPSANLDVLEEQGLIWIDTTCSHSVRIRIPAMAEVVRRHVPPGRSSMLCGGIQDSPAGASWTGGEAQRFAAWTLSCGYPLAHQAALTASQHANAQQDGRRALRFLEAVPASQMSAEMVAEKVRALTRLERYSAAHALLSQHEAPHRLSVRQADRPVSEEPSAGKQAVPISPLEAAGIELALSTQESHSRRAIDMLAALPAPRKDEETDPSTAVLLSGIWAAVGRADDGASLAAKAVSQYPCPEAGRHRIVAALLHSLFISGRWQELTDLIRRHADDGYNGDSNLAAVCEVVEGVMQSFCGRHREALQLLQPAVKQLRLQNICGLLPVALAAAAYAYGLQGKTDISAVLLEEMSAEGITRRQLPYLARFFVALSAEQAGSRTAGPVTSVGKGPLLEAAAQWSEAGLLSYEMLALISALLLGHHGAADRLITIAPKIHGPLAELSLMYARGAASKDAGGLVDAAQFAEAIGQLQWSVSMAAEALACDSKALTTEQMIWAQMAIAGRKEPSSNGQADSGAANLTEREREVAVRAASGTSNRQIASELNLSTRTVEGHLYQIYAKMRISCRSELSMALSALS